MRGDFDGQNWMLTPLTPESFVPPTHPIRAIRELVDKALVALLPTFKAMYSAVGRPSVPPEHLLKAMLLMALYSIRSERQLCERLQYDLLFKYFLGLNIVAPVFDHSTFSKNRQRLLEHEVSRKFFLAVREEAQRRQLLSAEHFTVDGTLLEAWASLKSVRPRDEDDGPAGAGGGRNQAVNFELSQAHGRAEREAALRMLDRQRRRKHRRVTLGADKGYDSREFISELRKRRVTPHVAQNTAGRRSAVDGRVTSHGGYTKSQRARKRVEEIFGWIKTVGGGRKLRFIGLARNRFWTEITASAYNLVRLTRLSTVRPTTA